jgi:hypothetical protein
MIMVNNWPRFKDNNEWKNNGIPRGSDKVIVSKTATWAIQETRTKRLIKLVRRLPHLHEAWASSPRACSEPYGDISK